MDNSKFNPFDIPTQAQLDLQQYELLDLAIAVSIESGKLLECIALKNIAESKTFATQLKQKLEVIFSKLPSAPANYPINYIAFTGATQSQEVKQETKSSYTHDYPTYVSNMLGNSLKEKEEEFLRQSREHAMSKKFGRELDNGGMAPPKEWKSITELNLKNSEKNNLIEEMRKLKEKGITISKSSFHYKTPINIEEFTEPFRYMETMHDYNGSFLITLLKSDMDITNQAATFQVDLKEEKDSCANGETIILSVLDITGSVSNGEEKKFIIVLKFDKLRGTLKYSHSVFMNNKKTALSIRQLAEVDRFCKAKKINIH